MKKTLKIGKKIFNIVCVIILAVVVFLTVNSLIAQVSGNTPSLFGYSLYRVSSGSMEPELLVGDVLLSHEVETSEISVDDIITFDGGEQYPGKLVTHKVIKAPYDDGGRTMVQTKGVANSYADNPVPVESIEGKIICKIPVLRWIYNAFFSPFGLILVIALIIFIFLDEVIRIIKVVTSGDKLKENKDSINDIIDRVKNNKDE
ncbi:MAG: signal peptidase I [Ruminococcus sp.]|nr:signal peptidase I [Ruminococcus sp.]